MKTRFPPWMCSGCGYMMDAASHLSQPNLKPSDGDMSLCLNCGTLYQLRRRAWALMTPAERNALPADIKLEVLQYEMARRSVVRADLSRRGRVGRV
jgi:hypothetical protein